MILQKVKVADFCDRAVFFSLCAIVFFLPISKAIIESFLYLAIFCYLSKKLIQRQDFPRTKLNFAILAYVIICFISIFLSSNFKISDRAFLAKVLKKIIFFFMVADTLNSKRRIKSLLYILFLSSLLLGIDGIYQHFTHKDFIRHRPFYDIPRIHATFPSANDLGCYLSAVIPFTLVCFFDKINFKKVLRFLLIGLFSLLFICLMLTVSRGAWFAFICSLLFMSIWVRGLGVFSLALGIQVILLYQFYGPFLKQRLANFFLFFDASSIDRNIIWETAWKMLMRSPWIGLGLGTFMFNFSKFVSSDYQFSAPYAHNCYLQIAAEIGIIGLVAFLSILVLFFSHGIEAVSYRKRDFFWYVLLAAQASLLGYCVQMAVDTNFYSLDLGLLFWFILGMGAAAMRNMELEAMPEGVKG